jgi:hypothetical protein
MEEATTKAEPARSRGAGAKRIDGKRGSEDVSKTRTKTGPGKKGENKKKDRTKHKED